MAGANTFTYKINNIVDGSKFDCECLKKVLSDKQITPSEIDEFEDGWLIEITSDSVEVITQRNERLCGESDGQRYELVFESITLPSPEPFPSLNQSCTGNPKGTILVTNYPPGTTSEELLNFFESGISYGGRIQHVHFEEGYATITFFNPKVADIVCSKSPILFKEKSINIYKDTDNIKEPAKENASQIATKTISVGNVPEEIDLEIASQWSKVQHDKFDCDLYYDDEDKNEMYMDINISSAFKLQFIMSHKQVFEDEVKDCGYPVWFKSSENSLKLMLNKGIEEQEIERKFNALLDTIFEEELNISPNLFPELKETYNHESDAVRVYFDDNNHMVHIFSFKKSLAAEHKGKMLSIVESKSNIEKELELAPHKMSLLFADLFPSKIFKTYEMLKITKDAKKIILTGCVSDINNVTREIYKYLSALSSTQCPLPHHASEIVTKKKVEEYLQKNLNEGKIICSWEINPEKQVIIYALNNENLMSANNIFKNSFMELNFDLTDPIKKIMEGEGWQTFLKSMSAKYIDIFHIDDQQKERISIVTTKEFSQDIGNDFGNFFDTNVIYTSTLPLKCGFYDFLITFCMTDINKFCQDHKSVHIGFQDDQTIHISGTNQVNKDASEFLKNHTESIIDKREMISHFGFKKFLKTDAAYRMFRELSHRNKCIILKEEEIKHNNIVKRSSSSSISLHMGDITELEVDAIVNPANKQLQHIRGSAKLISEKETSIPQKPTKTVEKATPSRTKIEIELGLLNKTKCDVIVNTTHSSLDLRCGGISTAILADAGEELQVECYQHTVKPNTIVVTGGYKLPCTKVFHVSLPHWSQSSIHLIKTNVRNCLAKADELRFSEIAFPSFGTGHLCYPPHIVASAMFSAASEYISDTETGLQKISFVIYPKDTLIKKAFENANSGGTLVSDVPYYDLPMSENAATSNVTQDILNADINGINFIVLKGNILDVNVDSIVHGTNQLFSLNGAISKALRNRMGDQLTNDCKAKSAEMQSHNYAITKASSLAAAYILHINMEGIKKNADKVFKLCFTAAEKEKMTSLALPVLGTGVLGCSIQDITNNLLSALKDFSKSSPNYLKTVKFVIFDSTMVTEIDQIIGSKTGILVLDNILNADINGIKLIVLKGNILNENVDSIVHGTTRKFTLNGAVSEALLNRMGDQLTNDCKAKSAEMQSHNYAITKASSLAAAYILHINMEGIKKNADKVFKLCFTAAEKEKITSLALPVLGTGVLGCSIQDITKNFLSALKNFSESSPNYLKTVKFVSFDSTMFIEVCRIIGHETQTLFEKVKSHIPFLNRTQTKTGLPKGNISPSSVSLFFYANSLQAINKTKEAIISQYKKDYLISEEIEDKNIPDLPRHQIMKLQWEHEVKIEIKGSKITINGYKDDVLSVTGDIQKMILSFVDEMKTKNMVLLNYTRYDQN